MFVFLYPSSRYPLQVAIAEHSGLIQLCAGLWRAVLCFMSFYKHLFCISLLLSCRAEGAFSSKHLKSHLKQEILNKWHALKAPARGEAPGGHWPSNQAWKFAWFWNSFCFCQHFFTETGLLCQFLYSNTAASAVKARRAALPARR